MLLDTAAAQGSSDEAVKSKTYVELAGQVSGIDVSRAAAYDFGIWSATSLCMGFICFLLSNCWLSSQVHGAVVYTSKLVSVEDMERLEIYLNSLEDALVHSQSELKASTTWFY